jgi:hypothetical protein
LKEKLQNKLVNVNDDFSFALQVFLLDTFDYITCSPKIEICAMWPPELFNSSGINDKFSNQILNNNYLK